MPKWLWITTKNSVYKVTNIYFLLPLHIGTETTLAGSQGRQGIAARTILGSCIDRLNDFVTSFNRFYKSLYICHLVRWRAFGTNETLSLLGVSLRVIYQLMSNKKGARIEIQPPSNMKKHILTTIVIDG